MWFLIALIGYAFLAVVFILDKLIISTAKEKPVVYTFYSTIFMLVALLALPFIKDRWLIGNDWSWAIVSGVGFGFGLWTLYLAIAKGEASHLNPFNGAMVTFFIYFLAFLFLQEKLTALQVVGIIILVLASLLLSFEKTRTHSGFHVGFLWAIVSGLFFAISHVSAKYIYAHYPFWTGLIWTKATTGLVGLLLLFSPVVIKSFQRKKEKINSYARRHAGFIMTVDKALSILAVILIQYAMSIGSVTLVGALSGLQYVLMFILIYLLTKFLPKLFSEYFTKREMVVEVIAIILMVIGSVFFVL